jgi:hypothetical protein
MKRNLINRHHRRSAGRDFRAAAVCLSSAPVGSRRRHDLWQADRPHYDQPGAYFKWPWPIQKVYKFDQRVQNFEDKFSQTLTADNNMLLTSVYVGWKISTRGSFCSFSRRFRVLPRRASSKACCAAPKAPSSAGIRCPIL